MAESSGEKTFDPTAHRREQAREQGQVAFSQDLGSAVLLVVGGMLFLFMGSQIVEFSAGLMRRDLETVATLTPDPGLMMVHWQVIMKGLAAIIFPMLGYLVLAAMPQICPRSASCSCPTASAPISAGSARPRGSSAFFRSPARPARLRPVQSHHHQRGGRGGDLVAARCDSPRQRDGRAQLGSFLADLTLKTVLWCGLALVLLALFDYGLQRWKHEQDLKMTHQEVREEMKELQGDPQIIARRRQIQRQMVINRISSPCPKPT